MSHAKLIKAVAEVLEEIRDQERKVCEDVNLEYKDPLADVTLKAEGVGYVYTTDGGNQIHTGESRADVSLTFDGAGYDYFSYNAEGMYVPEFGGYIPPMSEKYRERLREIAKAHGYNMEDVTSYAIGFYRQ